MSTYNKVIGSSCVIASGASCGDCGSSVINRRTGECAKCIPVPEHTQYKRTGSAKASDIEFHNRRRELMKAREMRAIESEYSLGSF